MKFITSLEYWTLSLAGRVGSILARPMELILSALFRVAPVPFLNPSRYTAARLLAIHWEAIRSDALSAKAMLLRDQLDDASASDRSKTGSKFNSVEISQGSKLAE